MNNKLILLILALTTLVSSCVSIRVSSMKDDELIQAGIEAWNTQKTEDARPYWEAIKDEKDHSKYLKYFDTLAELDALQLAALEIKPTLGAKQEKAFVDIMAKYNSFPENLRPRKAMNPNIRPFTVTVATFKLKSGKLEGAKSVVKDSIELFGDGADLDPLRKEMDAYGRIQVLEQAADRSLSAARAKEDFNDKIAAFEGTIAEYQKVEGSAAREATTLNAANDSAIPLYTARIKKKRGDVRIEMERLLRERGTSFKERIGEEFARVPEASKIGNMGPADILKFNEEIKANVEAQYKEVLAFSLRYPKVIDQDMIRDVEAQKAALNARIAQIEGEIRHAKDIASRGKAALPLLIGLFNPQPGSKAEGEKSRPAVLRGSITSAADYWWGMISIDPGKMNDLVVTLKDGKEVQVYSENTLSGSMIDQKKLTNLVSRGNRIGNSWPVLNAGNVLKNSQYYLKILANATPAYTGEVVVYSSFIARMR